MAKNEQEKDAIDEAAKKLQEEKEALLNEIKGTYGKLDEEKGKAEEATTETTETTDSTSKADSQIETGSSEIGSDTGSGEDSLPDDLSDDLEEGLTQTAVMTGSPMPKYGKGFLFVPITTVLTIAAIVLGHIPPITSGIPSNQIFRYIYIGFGALLIAAALILIVNAINDSDILTNAQMGKLVTTGIYSKTRNPMYAGVLFACTGALFISGNAFMYALPILYWLFLTVLVQKTEEPLLLNRFEDEYKEYMENTYRVFPLPKN